MHLLVGYVAAKREAAQLQLEGAGKNYPSPLTVSWPRRWPPSTSPTRFTCAHSSTWLSLGSTGLLKGLELAASVDPEGYEDLHQIRILGKRLRYAMEVFADCFAPAFREELYPAVESMQEILGNANDSHVACTRLEALSSRLQALARRLEWKRSPSRALRVYCSIIGAVSSRAGAVSRSGGARWCQSGGEESRLCQVLLEKAGEPSEEVPPPQIAPPIWTNLSQAQ